jgi:hypothetical protein
MKTTTKNASDIKLNEETFNYVLELINTTISSNKPYIDLKNDWKVNGDLQQLPALMSNCKPTSLSRRKEMKKRIFYLFKNVTITRINNLMTAFNISGISIEPSIREQEIINSRRAYVKLRNEARESYSKYKAIKGDYYKLGK